MKTFFQQPCVQRVMPKNMLSFISHNVLIMLMTKQQILLNKRKAKIKQKALGISMLKHIAGVEFSRIVFRPSPSSTKIAKCD